MPDRAVLAQFFARSQLVSHALVTLAQAAGWRSSSARKISNALGCLTGARRMIVDAREKRVSLVSEFPLRGSNGAHNGSLMLRTRDSRTGGALGPDTFHREAGSRERESHLAKLGVHCTIITFGSCGKEPPRVGRLCRPTPFLSIGQPASPGDIEAAPAFERFLAACAASCERHGWQGGARRWNTVR
jgi:hypothetical protein